MPTITAIADGNTTQTWANALNALITVNNATGQYLVAPDTAVVTPTLLNSWVNFGSGYLSAGYWKDSGGWVHTYGRVKDGTATGGTIIFTYGSGYRPGGILIGATISASAIGSYVITADGHLQIISGSNANFSLFIPAFKAA